jgi:hypothetical protein
MVQLLRGLAEDPKYQEGVTTLLELMDEISNYLKETVVKSEKKAKEYTTLQKAVKEARYICIYKSHSYSKMKAQKTKFSSSSECE